MAADTITFNNDTVNLATVPVTQTTLSGTLTVDYAANTVTGTLVDGSNRSYTNFSIVSNSSGNYVLSSTTGNATFALSVTYPNTTMAPATVTTNSSTLVGIANAQTTNVAVTSAPVCFCSGTLIRTVRGDVAVEALRIGDLVVTEAGAHRAIRWLGHRRTNCAAHPMPETVWPYRVRAGTLGEGLPYADLWLSPGHSLCLDDVLLPVRALAHGDLVSQVAVDEVTYWHVELDSHDILFANGAASESYLDTGNRNGFDNAPYGARQLHPDFEPLTTVDFCRPYIASGPVLSRLRARLFEAKSRPQAVPQAALGLHLIADGAVLLPVHGENDVTFLVPTTSRELRLVSPSFAPPHPDERTLGVLIGTITLRDSRAERASRVVALDDPALVAGFHPTEVTDGGTWRWTDGNAHFGADLWSGFNGSFLLCLTGLFDCRPVTTIEEVPAERIRHAA